MSGSGPYARGASEVSLDLYDGSSWVSVWSARLVRRRTTALVV